jgi:homoserine/homoserine lactone efflux protein
MSLGLWLVFFGTALTATLLPGPSSALVFAHGMSYGPRKALWTAVGVNLAVVSLMVVATLSAQLATSLSSDTFRVLRWCGVIVMLYVAYGMWQEPAAPHDPAGPIRASSKGAGGLLLSGFVVGGSNPKALIFFVALFPQFLDPARPLLPQLVVLAPTWVICEFGWLTVYAFAGRGLSNWMRRSNAETWIRRACAGLVLAIALAAALTALLPK